jgi:hypothetical protein
MTTCDKCGKDASKDGKVTYYSFYYGHEITKNDYRSHWSSIEMMAKPDSVPICEKCINTERWGTLITYLGLTIGLPVIKLVLALSGNTTDNMLPVLNIITVVVSLIGFILLITYLTRVFNNHQRAGESVAKFGKTAKGRRKEGYNAIKTPDEYAAIIKKNAQGL